MRQPHLKNTQNKYEEIQKLENTKKLQVANKQSKNEKKFIRIADEQEFFKREKAANKLTMYTMREEAL